MTEEGVWQILGSISIGTIVAWILVLTAVGIALYKAGRFVFNFLKQVKDIVDNSNNLDGRFQEIEDNFTGKFVEMEGNIEDIKECLSKIKSVLDAQREEKVAEQRHIIVKAGEEYVERGYVKVRELRSLNEVFEQYSIPGPDGKPHNGYAATLVRKVNDLPVLGKLDEHGEDIYDEDETC